MVDPALIVVMDHAEQCSDGNAVLVETGRAQARTISATALATDDRGLFPCAP